MVVIQCPWIRNTGMWITVVTLLDILLVSVCQCITLVCVCESLLSLTLRLLDIMLLRICECMLSPEVLLSAVWMFPALHRDLMGSLTWLRLRSLSMWQARCWCVSFCFSLSLCLCGDGGVAPCRDLIMGISMTACDLCAMYKPWQTQLDLVYVIMEEFWQQVSHACLGSRYAMPWRQWRQLSLLEISTPCPV